jgi:NAD(P)H-hydrate epimerase
MIRLTRAQVREVDRRAIGEYHIPGVVLMENAARGATEVALEMLAGSTGPALILCGGGNNGGDGLAVARHLHNRGRLVRVMTCANPERYEGDALTNWRIVNAMSLAIEPVGPDRLPSGALVIDAIFGTGLSQAPRPPFVQIVHAVERSGIPVLAIDLPSGLDCDTGMPLDPAACIRAERTVTFVAEKAGFANPAAGRFTGMVTVADIGCPRELIDQVIAARPGDAR